MYDVLSDLFRWYSSETVYNSDAIGPQLNGFLRRYPTAVTAGAPPGEYLNHAAFKTAVNKWQMRMLAVRIRLWKLLDCAWADQYHLIRSLQAFKASFESDEYMHIKNSILVLTKIAPYFPIQHATGTKLLASVSDLVVAEKRDDLKILAQGLAFFRPAPREEH